MAARHPEWVGETMWMNVYSGTIHAYNEDDNTVTEIKKKAPIPDKEWEEAYRQYTKEGTSNIF